MLKIQELTGAMPLDHHRALLLDPVACVGTTLEGLTPPPPWIRSWTFDVSRLLTQRDRHTNKHRRSPPSHHQQ